MSRDFLGVWMAPVALTLPPPYAAAMVAVPLLYTQLRVWRRDPIKLAYSIASIGLAWAACSAAVGLVLGPGRFESGTGAFRADSLGALAIGIGIAAWLVVNYVLIGGVVALTSGRATALGLIRNAEGMLTELVDVSVGIVAAALWSTSPFAIAFLIPPVLLMQHQLFSGLRDAVRRDLLTDVANPQFWRETAAREVARASASGSNLSVLMIDIDHFKEVNDRYGHLAGDEVLAAVARTISTTLRPGDLVGRLGGEEFAAILAGLNLLDAQGAAQRLRSQVAAIRVRSDRGEWISVSVSIGVAEMSVAGPDIRALLDAADVALYAAKAAGRDCVRVAGPRPGEVIDLTSPQARLTRKPL